MYWNEQTPALKGSRSRRFLQLSFSPSTPPVGQPSARAAGAARATAQAASQKVSVRVITSILARLGVNLSFDLTCHRHAGRTSIAPSAGGAPGERGAAG